MRQCSVPGCRSAKPLHAVPFCDKYRWKQWTTLLPYLQKYNLRQLENVRICNKHFLPRHINEKGRLTKDAVPLFHLNNPKKPYKHNKKNNVFEGYKILEISPIQSNEPVFKVLTSASLPAQADNTSKRPSTEDTHGPPLDHNMYCLPSPADNRQKRLSSPCVTCQTPTKELLSSDSMVVHCDGGTPLPNVTVGCVSASNAGQHMSEPLLPDVKCNIKPEPVSQGTVNAQLWPHIIVEGLTNAASNDTASVETDAVALHNISIQQSEQVPDSLCADIEHSLQDEMEIVEEGTMSAASNNKVSDEGNAVALHNIPIQQSEQVADSLSANSLKDKLETAELLLNSQFITPGNNDIQESYILPSDTVADQSIHTDSKEQSAIYLSPNVFNLLTSKSPLEKETLESIQALFSALKDQYNLPFKDASTEYLQTSKFIPGNNHTPTEYSQRRKFTPENPSVELDNPSELNIQPSVKQIESLVQPLHNTSAQKQTLETLVSEVTESVNAEETAELRHSPVMAVYPRRRWRRWRTPACPLNPLSDAAPCPSTQDFPVGALHPSSPSNTEIRRVRLDKENSTPNERMLCMQNNMLKLKLRNINHRYRKLKSKSDTILAKAKEFIKNYPHLNPEGKLMVDLQIRLARTHPKGARYSDEEKTFAFKLLQISPECYKFMQPLLKLPALTTMKCFEKNA